MTGLPCSLRHYQLQRRDRPEHKPDHHPRQQAHELVPLRMPPVPRQVHTTARRAMPVTVSTASRANPSGVTEESRAQG